jgi:GT2 family glycosyltransferase
MNPEEIDQILAPPAADRSLWCCFDHEWYLCAYADAAERIGDAGFAAARADYLLHGRHLRHSPNMYFDEAWYLHRYPDAANSIEAGEFGSGYEHYCLIGYPERSPHWLYDSDTYLTATADLAEADLMLQDCVNRYDHYLRHGARAGLIAHPLFDPAVYVAGLAGEPGAAEAIAESGAFTHFLRRIWFEHRDAHTSSWFDPDWFLAHYPQAHEAVATRRYACALHCYLVEPATPPRDPLPRADAAAPAAVEAVTTGRGHVDQFGYYTPARRWFCVGWLSPEHAAIGGPLHAALEFADGDVPGEAAMSVFAREDVAGRGIGMLLAIDAPAAPGSRLTAVTVTGAGFSWHLLPPGGPALDDTHLRDVIAPLTGRLLDNAHKPALTALAGRRPYTGANTLGELRERVFLEVDEAILCPPGGLALVGWMLAAPGTITAIRVISGAKITPLRLDDCVRVERPDVIDNLGRTHGFTDPASGFVAWLPDAITPDAGVHIEVETARGQFGHRGIPEAKLRDMDAIRFLLDRTELRYGAVAPAFDRVLGPAIARLNAARLAEPTRREIIDFGPQPAAPVLSVVVTLYGRLDFIEYQFAFLSRHEPAVAVEFVYVLDDPPRRRQAEDLAASVFARFRIPFRLVLLERNLGFAPANNAGLAEARGEYVCFANSDVFANTPDWMERLVARLRADPALGAVGPLLLYEDDCVQHQGMGYERLPAFADWLFPVHPRKGWRPPQTREVVRVPAITGACMMLATDRVRRLGGFDEAFVIGDFEDSDLCMKLHAEGLACAVDLDTRLYHLERQSQAPSQHRWRMNLTLYNAWLHEARWGETIAALPGAVTEAAP